jgi:hypothetical protein
VGSVAIIYKKALAHSRSFQIAAPDTLNFNRRNIATESTEKHGRKKNRRSSKGN